MTVWLGVLLSHVILKSKPDFTEKEKQEVRLEAKLRLASC